MEPIEYFFNELWRFSFKAFDHLASISIANTVWSSRRDFLSPKRVYSPLIASRGFPLLCSSISVISSSSKGQIREEPWRDFEYDVFLLKKSFSSCPASSIRSCLVNRFKSVGVSNLETVLIVLTSRIFSQICVRHATIIKTFECSLKTLLIRSKSRISG